MPSHTYAVPPVSYVTQKPWTNWGGNQTCTPAFTVRPESEQEVVDAVRFAIKQRLPVRAFGAGHSFTPIVQTGGVLIDTEALTGLTGVDTRQHWGKIHFLTRERIEKEYPEYDKFAEVRREFDPSVIFLNDKGSGFKTGAWNLGRNYRWLCVIAVVEISLTTVIAILPTSPGGVPWNHGFAWKYVNYTPIVVGGTLLALWLAWQIRVKNTYTGPRHTVDLPPGVTSADMLEKEYEAHHPGHHHHMHLSHHGDQSGTGPQDQTATGKRAD
jgi:hypothetical protein